jgi:hypothetical protein
MSRYRGKMVSGLCLLGNFIGMYGMEVSMEDYSLCSLHYLYDRLKEDVTHLQRGQKKQKRKLKEMKEEQRYTLLILSAFRSEQRGIQKEIKKLQKKIARQTYENRLQLKMLECTIQQELTLLENHIQKTGLVGSDQDQQQENGGPSFVWEEFSDNTQDPDGGWFEAASSSSDGFYGELP